MAKRLGLHSWHASHAKMGEYAGWEMPILYSSITEEHLAVRNDIGIFDVSHMGEIFFSGKDALEFLQYACTNDISVPPPYSGTYTLILNERGAIKDEGLVCNLGDKYMLVYDAVAVDKIDAWLQTLLRSAKLWSAPDVVVENVTDRMFLFAVQGPKTPQLARDITGIDINSMWWFQQKKTEILGKEVILSKSGYTGENGFELFILDDKDKAMGIWELLFEKGKKYGIKPCGLAARDTLRIEAGYTLYGHEEKELQLLSVLIDSVSAIEAGFDKWVFPVIKWEKDFVGKRALLEQQKQGAKKKIIHFELEEAGIPREGYLIKKNDVVVGYTTSGTQSIITKKGIGIGFVDVGVNVGNQIHIVIKEKEKKARVVIPPFYDPEKYGVFRKVIQ